MSKVRTQIGTANWLRSLNSLHYRPFNLRPFSRSELKNQNFYTFHLILYFDVQGLNLEIGTELKIENQEFNLYPTTITISLLSDADFEKSGIGGSKIRTLLKWFGLRFLRWSMPDFFTWSSIRGINLIGWLTSIAHPNPTIEITLSRSQQLLDSSDCRSPINYKSKNQKS